MKLSITPKTVLPKQKDLLVFYSDKNKVLIPKSLGASYSDLNNFLTEFIKSFSADFKKNKNNPSFFKIFDNQLSEPGRKIFLARLQKPDKASESWQVELGADICKKIMKENSTNLYVVMPEQINNNQGADFCEGMLLGGYKFDRYFTDKKSLPSLSEIFIITSNKKLSEKLKTTHAIVDSIKNARDFGNLGGSDFTPVDFTKYSKTIAKAHNLKLTTLNDSDFKKLGMGLFAAVAKGSKQPPCLNILEYKALGSKDTLLLVGKGITFDSGGYSLKPPTSMEEMKFDMCGASAVIAVMNLVGAIKPKVNVVGMIASAENLISGQAYKPGDIFTAYNKKTVEIINTDAEGRLILADSLAYGVKRYKPTAVIDLATLTGACMVALGKWHSGLFSNNDKLTNLIKQASSASSESVWHLPVGDEYSKELKSKYADLKNVGSRWGGASSAAKFLEAFVDKTPWAHLDIAATAWDLNKPSFYPEQGATGAGIKLLYHLITKWAGLKN